jgi:hypothetical protein
MAPRAKLKRNSSDFHEIHYGLLLFGATELLEDEYKIKFGMAAPIGVAPNRES